MTKSLYTILNVAPDADPAVIEAAYKALIKKYHPDVVTAQADTGERRAAEINEAFYVLRDPARRADYDSQAQLGTNVMRVSPPAAANARSYPFPPPAPPPPIPRRSAGIWFLLLLLVLGGAVFYVWRGAALPEQFASASHTDVSTEKTVEAVSPPLDELPAISSVTLDRALFEFEEIQKRSGLLGLASRSQDCFAEQSRSGRVEDFDFCIAFDNAVLTYDPGTPGSMPFPNVPRFESRELLSRHLRAGRLVSDDETLIADRLSRIGYLVREKLVTPTSNDPPPLPPANMVRNEVAPPKQVRLPRFTMVEPARPKLQTRPRAQRPRKDRKSRRKAADSEFMEREGYIY